MRRRAKRDLTVLFSLVVVIGLVAFANYNFNRSDLTKRMNALRMEKERGEREKGYMVLDWKIITETKGSARSGPQFLDDLKEKDGQQINIVGFMQPLNQFREMTEFILLPLPIECYFCRIPPIAHVVLVHMAEGENTNLFKEPVVLNGTLTLGEGPGTKFFYTIENARLGPDQTLTPRYMKEEHMAPGHEVEQDLQQGFEPPTVPEL